jgi:Zn-dependent protease
VKTGVLLKVAFWLMVVGAVALVTPNPAWPAWAGWSAIVGGAVLIPVGLLYGGRRASRGNRAHGPGKDG